MAPIDDAGVDRKRIVNDARRASYQRANQSRLADSVAAHEPDLLAARDAGGEVRNHPRISIRLREAANFESMPSRRALHLEADEGTLNVGPRQIAGLEALHFLLARRYLARTRAGREARDELIELGDLFFALRVVGFDAAADL